MKLIPISSPEWYAARKGRLSTKETYDALNFGSVRNQRLIERIIQERYVGRLVEGHARSYDPDIKRTLIASAFHDKTISPGGMIVGASDLEWYCGTVDAVIDKLPVLVVSKKGQHITAKTVYACMGSAALLHRRSCYLITHEKRRLSNVQRLEFSEEAMRAFVDSVAEFLAEIDDLFDQFITGINLH